MRVSLQRTYLWPWRVPSRSAAPRAENVQNATPAGLIREKLRRGAAPLTPPSWAFSSIPGPSPDLLFARQDRRPSVVGSPVKVNPGVPPVVSRVLALSGVIGIVAVVVFFAGGFERSFTAGTRASAAQPAAVQPANVPPATGLRMGPLSTGIPAVDSALHGFLAGNADEAASKLVLEKVECGALSWGGTPALACAADEATGTTHELFLAGCERGWIKREAARAEFGTLLASKPGLLSLSAVKANVVYHAVLSWPQASDKTLLVTIDSTGVTAYSSGCGSATGAAAP